MRREFGYFLVLCFMVTTFTGCTSNDQEKIKIKAITTPAGAKGKSSERTVVDQSKMTPEEINQIESVALDVRKFQAFLLLADQIFDQTWSVIHESKNLAKMNVFKGTLLALQRIYNIRGIPYEVDEQSCQKNHSFVLMQREAFAGYQLLKTSCQDNGEELMVTFSKKKDGPWTATFLAGGLAAEMGTALSFLHKSPTCNFFVSNEFQVDSIQCEGIGQDSPTEQDQGRYIVFSEMTFVRTAQSPLIIKGTVFKGFSDAGLEVPEQQLGLIDVPAENILKFHVDVELAPKPTLPPVTPSVPNGEPAKQVSVPPEAPGNNNGNENNNGLGNNNGQGNNNGDPLPAPAPRGNPEKSRGAEVPIAAGQQGDGG
jgi:hypothetical protein